MDVNLYQIRNGKWESMIFSYPFKGILCDCFILTLEQIIVLNKYRTYNKPIPKISHVKTLQNLCKMKYTNNNKKVRNVDCEEIRAWIA